MTNPTNWAELYAPATIKSWGLPATEIIRPNDGVFSKLYLKWSELPRNPEIDLYTICVDVLLIDVPVVIERSTYIFARRIEVGPNGSLSVERALEPVALVLAAGEVVVAGSDTAQALTINVLTGDGTAPQTYGGAAASVVRVIELEDEPAPRRYNVDELDEDYLLEGEPLRVHLRCIFQLAVLLSTEYPETSVRQLNWVASLATASPDTRIICGEARALAANLQAMAAQKDNVLLVPDLDYTVYRDSARAFLELLNRRQTKQDAMDAAIADEQRWLDAAKDALARDANDDALNTKLVTKAKATRDQVLDARATIARQIAGQRLVLFSCEQNFEAGVKIWKREEQAKAILKLVSGIMKVLSAIPTMVVAGPSMGLSSVMTIATTTINLAMHAGALSIGDKSKAPLSPSGGSGAATLWQNTKDELRAQGYDPENDPDGSRFQRFISIRPISSWSTLGGNGLPEVRPSVPEGEWSIVGDLFDDEPDALRADYDKGRQAELVKARAMAGELAKRRKAAQNELNKGIAEMGKGGEEIMDAAVALAGLEAKAERLTSSANAALTTSNDAIDAAFSSTELTGIDVVTGGKQVWENLALAIDNFFERNPTLDSIFGGKAYRTEMRRLIMMGKTYAETRLAVAKASAELAEMLMRQAASERNVAVYEARVKELGAAAAKDQAIAQLAFGKILDAKRAVYLAMEAYSRAFTYFTMADGDYLPKLPKFTDSVDTFNRIGASIAGNRLADETLKKIGEAPQTIPLNAYKIPVADIPAALFATNSMTLLVSADTKHFAGVGRVRLNRVRVFAEGLDTTADVIVRIATSGHYEDKAKDGSVHAFASTPRKFSFIYNGADPTVIRQDGDIARRYEDDFFHPTPFTHWTVSFATRDDSPIDLKTITGLRVEFSGESSSI